MTWVLTDKIGQCFFCGKPTKRLDTTYDLYLCGCVKIIPRKRKKMTIIACCGHDITEAFEGEIEKFLYYRTDGSYTVLCDKCAESFKAWRKDFTVFLESNG